MKANYLGLLVLVISTQCGLLAQSVNRDKYQMDMRVAGSPITLDGVIDEQAWMAVEPSTKFINKWPTDTGWAEAQTQVRLMYDEEFVYVSAICYQDMDELVIQSLKRDDMGDFWGSDGFSIVLDPIGQRSNGYLFGLNAGGAQVEATLSQNGNQTDFDSNWDNKWYSAVTAYDDRWEAEMAIPFKSIRYSSSKSTWAFNLIRNDMKRNLYSTWTSVPLVFRGIDFGYYGTMNWDTPPAKTNGNIAFIPYLASGVSNNPEDNEPTEGKVNVGGDAKVALSSSLNLDLTLNPDFSNVDVDQQVTNVSQFSVFFPEKRSFFLENSDLFAGFGPWQIKPFFSRTIGIYDGEQVPIAFGARISGNLTDNLRVGIMDVHTKETADLSAHNYLVTSIEQRVLNRSSIKMMFNNMQSMQAEEGGQLEYNRTAGSEFNYSSVDGRWTGALRGHWSTTEDDLKDNLMYSAQMGYQGNHFSSGMSYSNVQTNYLARMGFTPRLFHTDAVSEDEIRIGYQNLFPWVAYQWTGGPAAIFRQQELNAWSAFQFGQEGDFMSKALGVNWYILFKNNIGLSIAAVERETQLQVLTDLIDQDVPLPEERYKFGNLEVNISSNASKRLSTEAGVSVGQYFSGEKYTLTESVKLRMQPWGVLSVAYEYNYVNLGEPYGSAKLHLVGAKSEISLRNNMWWTTFFQLNTQGENVNINSRLQWRYKPMSDLFVVYSDNYASQDFETKNRGIVFKLTYWLNI